MHMVSFQIHNSQGWPEEQICSCMSPPHPNPSCRDQQGDKVGHQRWGLLWAPCGCPACPEASLREPAHGCTASKGMGAGRGSQAGTQLVLATNPL